MRRIDFGAVCFLLGASAVGAAILGACSDPGIDDDLDPLPDSGDPDVWVDSPVDTRPERTPRDASDANDAQDGDAGPDVKGDADADAKDAGKPEASLPDPGTPCSPLGATQTQKCGYCGTQERTCLDPEDSGTPVWQEWGFCQFEVDGGCLPGTTETLPCDKCGTIKVTCTSACTWPSGICQDAGPCWPGQVDFGLGVSCTDGGRVRVCGDDCRWDPYENECVSGPSMEIPTDIGVKVYREFIMRDMPKIDRVNTTDGGCPNATLTTTQTSYHYLRLDNPTDFIATVSVWHSRAQVDGAAIDTIIGVYDTLHPPPHDDPAARGACMPGTSVIDLCRDAAGLDDTACKDNWGGFTIGDNRAVVIQPHSHVWIYSAAWFTTGFGEFRINLMTHSLEAPPEPEPEPEPDPE